MNSNFYSSSAGLVLVVAVACANQPEPGPTSAATTPSRAAPELTAPQVASATPVTQGQAAPTPTSAPPPPPAYEQADLDPDNDAVVAPPEPLADCEAQLTAAGIEFRSAEFPLKQKRGNVFTCGAEQVVTYLQGPENIKFNARPTFTCRMALATGRFEQLAQEEAERFLNAQVVKVVHMGTYSCRKMARFQMVSEHSYANAIDIKSFVLSNGRRISVKQHFGSTGSEPDTPEGKFLRSLARRLFDERVYSVVLTPFWDRLHHDHFHFDLARYRVDGTRK